MRAWMLGVSILVALDGPLRISLNVSPRLTSAPATIRCQVSIDPRPEHRAAHLEASSDDFYRSSAWQLEGENAPRTFWVEWRLPAGDYQVIASVADANRVLATVRQSVLVIP